MIRAAISSSVSAAAKQSDPAGKRGQEIGDLLFDRWIVDASVRGNVLPSVQHKHFWPRHRQHAEAAQDLPQVILRTRRAEPPTGAHDRHRLAIGNGLLWRPR